MHNLGLAIQIYLLGFVIALAMACIIKLMMLFFSIHGRRKSRTAEKTVSSAASEKAQSKEGEGGAS